MAAACTLAVYLPVTCQDLIIIIINSYYYYVVVVVVIR